MELVIRNGTIVTHDGVFHGVGVAVDNGKIAMIAADEHLPSAEIVYDANRCYVIPGIIDSHVHFRDPGLCYKESFETGSAAAAVGGVTCVLDMPNTWPPTSSASNIGAKKMAASGRSWVDFGVLGLVDPSNVDQILALRDGGVLGYKCFLAQTDVGPGNPPVLDDGMLLDAMRAIRRTGLRLALHAENNDIVHHLMRKLQERGENDTSAHCESRPEVAEVEAIQRVCLFAHYAGAKVHVCHVSSSQGVETLKAWRAKGVDVTCETSANYCFLTANDAKRLGPILRINPPIRDGDHSRGLLTAVIAGEIDIIASDHAPHSCDEKLKSNVWEAKAGTIGVETSAQLFLSEVVRPGRMTLSDFVRATSYRPSHVWGLFPKKGALSIGSDADLTVVDMNKRWTIFNHQLHSKHPISAFHGWSGTGMPVATIVRGHVVMRDAMLEGGPRGEMAYSPSYPGAQSLFGDHINGVL